MNTNKILDYMSIFILLIIFIFSINSGFNSNYSNFCKSNTSCIVDLVNQTNNISLCSKANNTNNCYLFSAINLNKANICLNINENFIKNNCYKNLALKNQNISICKYTENSDKCIFQIAIEKKDFNICKFTEDKIRCVYSYAIIEKNSTICNLSGKFRKTCLDKLN